MNSAPVPSANILDRKPYPSSFVIIVKISQSLWSIGIVPVAFSSHIGQFHAVRRRSWLPTRRVQRMTIGGHDEKSTGFDRR